MTFNKILIFKKGDIGIYWRIENRINLVKKTNKSKTWANIWITKRNVDIPLPEHVNSLFLYLKKKTTQLDYSESVRRENNTTVCKRTRTQTICCNFNLPLANDTFLVICGPVFFTRTFSSTIERYIRNRSLGR